MNYRVASDAVLRVAGSAWVLSNPRSRRHLELDLSALQALTANPGGLSSEAWAEAFAAGQAWDRSCFSNADGLMVDPTGFGPRRGGALQGPELFGRLKSLRLFQSEGGEEYRSFLAPHTSILDQEHLGTFHQAVGRFQLTELRRKDKWRWWHDQKFASDGRSIKPGLYAWVQEHFFRTFFATVPLQGKRVLDFGCGNGFYSELFRSFGAEVLGLDTSPELLEIARGNWSGVDFRLMAGEDQVIPTLEALPSGSFDVIYMSDVLLFFFHDLKTNVRNTTALEQLLQNFRRLLRRRGTLYLMEPNATFWLAPWYGEPPNPFTVVTEYRRQLYSVAPTVDAVVSSLATSGFAVSTFRHPEVCAWNETIDPLAHAFASNFPLWDFYGCQVLSP